MILIIMSLDETPERSAMPPSDNDTHDPELIINEGAETPPLSDDDDCFEVSVKGKPFSVAPRGSFN